MENFINPNVANIEISGIRKFFNMVSGQKDVVSLTLGQPDFPTPEHVKESGKAAIDQNYTTYTHNAGMAPLRKAIADFTEEKYQLQYDAAKEIIVTVGASQAIDITLRTVINPGDEVILPGPVYPGYEPLIRLAGGKPVYADTRDNDFKLTRDVLKKYITNRTKCVILPYPSNPTGATFTTEELQQLVNLLSNTNIFILADEIYSELVYERQHTSIASFKDVREQTIVINGLSKSHSMTGWRLGYLLAPSWVAKHILKVHQYNVSCASSISQHAALEALTTGKQDPLEMKEKYKQRRDFVYQRLIQMNLEVTKPQGAFYFFPKFPIKEMSSFDLGLKLVDKAHVALVPGDAFSAYGQGYMRLSYAYNTETLENGLDRMEHFLNANTLY